jgi:hypothetical protein
VKSSLEAESSWARIGLHLDMRSIPRYKMNMYWLLYILAFRIGSQLSAVQGVLSAMPLASVSAAQQQKVSTDYKHKLADICVWVIIDANGMQISIMADVRTTPVLLVRLMLNMRMRRCC